MLNNYQTVITNQPKKLNKLWYILQFFVPAFILSIGLIKLVLLSAYLDKFGIDFYEIIRIKLMIRDIPSSYSFPQPIVYALDQLNSVVLSSFVFLMILPFPIMAMRNRKRELALSEKLRQKGHV